MYRAFSPNGPYAVVPTALDLARDASGKPAVSLDLVRSKVAGFPPDSFGTFDMTLRLGFQLDDALAAARTIDVAAVVARAPVTAGTIRLVPHGELRDVPQDLLQAVIVSWVGAGTARYLVHLSVSAASFLHSMLEKGELTLEARAMLSLLGVAPRFPVTVTIAPDKLHAALGGMAASYDSLLLLFASFASGAPPPNFMSVTGSFGAAAPIDVAQTITDWVVARVGRNVLGNDVMVDISSLASIGTGARLEWDLSVPLATARPLTLSFSPQSALTRDEAAACVRTTEVPPFFTGVLPIDVVANLPPARRGVEVLGVEIEVPPNPPKRSQELKASVEFAAPSDAGRAMLRLSPAEAPAYQYSTFAVVRALSAVSRYNGKPALGDGSSLSLGVDDFELDFVPIEMSAQLAAVAALAVTASWMTDGTPHSDQFVLTAESATQTLALPRGWSAGNLSLALREKAGTRTLTLADRPLAALHLDLSSLPQYGTQTVTILCDLPPGTAVYAVDLAPESETETAGATGVVFFTPHETKRSWSYLARSPFSPGYRYRPHAPAAGAAAAWSDVRSPADPLHVRADAIAAPSGVGQ
jgi:hypothetical protein